MLSVLHRFATLATRMEQYIQGQSRDLVDQAYTKFVTIMFVTLEKIAQTDPKYADILLLENFAAFQNSLYDLANVVPTLAKFYHQASESYEQACMRHISMIIYIQFERLFQFARRAEDLMFTISPEEVSILLIVYSSYFPQMDCNASFKEKPFHELCMLGIYEDHWGRVVLYCGAGPGKLLLRREVCLPFYASSLCLYKRARLTKIPFQLGLSKMDLRKMLKSSLSGVDKSFNGMYKRLQKNLTSEELLPSLWDKCKKEFLDKYDSFAQLVAKIYPTETIPSVADMREILANM
ncbi:Exocyst complex component SEC3A [Vitis vinifera]|uniref:Exocyst complex component SEC3A n=1 Tax=Vitis vinifera TaxID=29760 RepID=A0A438K1A1_VITVI|nr:Exocyst complex component SEC3A [Vitis vinifera]